MTVRDGRRDQRPRTSACLGTALIAGAAIASFVSAATIRDLEVSEEDNRYTLVADTYLDASAQAIFDVLVDYENFDRISSIYKESGYLEPDEQGRPVVYTRVEGCVLFWCKSMTRVEWLETVEPTYIRTVTLPDRSDFRYATSEWVLEPEGGGTQVTYRLEMEPDFWVPPLIGTWFVKRKLKSGGERAINRIERLANGLPTHTTPGS